MIDNIKNNELFKVLVVSTMSSGKSTCINAIIGEDILLSKNQACTSKPTYIINDDNSKDFKAYVRYNDDSKKVFYIDNIYNMEYFEQDNSIVDVIIKGNINGIRNINKVVTFIDTPGVNFSGDDTHKNQTYNLIKNLDEGLILYLINATQFGINDDYELLCEVKRKIEKSTNKIKILFVINKVDEFDIEKESIDEFILEVKDYLNENGFKNADIVSVSALAAKLFNKKIKMNKLSRKEAKDLEHYYNLFKNDSYNLCDYKLIDLNENNDVLKAINNTGINLIKRYIEDLLIEENIVKFSKYDLDNKYENSYMKKIYIEYNPYKVETIFKINGEEVKTQKKYKSIANQKNKRLQHYLDSDDKNWRGLIKELIKVVNSKNLDIQFKGRKIDYDDLEYCVLRYKNDNQNTKFNINLKYIKAKEDEDIHKSFYELIEKIQKLNIKELQNPIIQNAIEKGKSTDFKMSVLSTMSSGKSTLINALIGNDLLPSSNKACTATIARIRDNDDKNEFTVECKDKNGKIVYNKKVITFNEEDTQGKITPKEIVKYNSDEKVMYIDIEGRIPEILSEKMNLVLQDTPGPNNSRNEKHGETTQTIIDDKNKGIVLYIMNATQLEINDDKELLDKISEAMKSGGKQSKDRFMFVLNKCDTIDSEKGETLKDIIGEVKNYLKQYKIEDPNIFPVSAQMAKVIRMHKQGVELTRVEKKFLNDYEDYIEYEYLHFDKLATLSESSRKVLEEKLNKAKEKNDKYEEALIHTGIPAIEVAINEYLEKYAYPMKIKKSTEQIQNFIKEQDMMNKLYTNLSEDKEQYKKIREEINIIKEKIDSGKKAKEIKTEINDFKLKTDNKLTEISDEIMKDLESIKVEIKKYEPKLEKNKARVIINDTKSKLEKYEKKFINTLNTFIKDNLIKNGEMLIEKYKKYISDLKEEFIIDGFEFENTLEFQNIKVKDIDNVINQYVEIEDIYGDVEYKNTNKKWYKPWTWFDPDTYTKKEKIGEKEYIYLEKLIQEQITQIDINVENNLDSAQDEYKEEIEKLIEYFKSEVDKIDEFLKLKINQLDKFTINEETIKIKLKESKNMVERMKDINLDLDKLLKM